MQDYSDPCRLLVFSALPINLKNSGFTRKIAGTDLAPWARRSRPQKELKMNKTRLFISLAIVTFITAGAQAQTPEQNINVRIRPSQTVEERVADEMKAEELKKAA